MVNRPSSRFVSWPTSNFSSLSGEPLDLKRIYIVAYGSGIGTWTQFAKSSPIHRVDTKSFS
jgi:hypothetical protein